MIFAKRHGYYTNDNDTTLNSTMDSTLDSTMNSRLDSTMDSTMETVFDIRIDTSNSLSFKIFDRIAQFFKEIQEVAVQHYNAETLPDSKSIEDIHHLYSCIMFIRDRLAGIQEMINIGHYFTLSVTTEKTFKRIELKMIKDSSLYMLIMSETTPETAITTASEYTVFDNLMHAAYDVTVFDDAEEDI